MHVPRPLTALALAAAGTLLAAGCGSGAGPENGSEASGSEPVVIEITLENGTVTPNGERVEVAAGQEIELDITADTAGKIHVHSSPEQQLSFDAGSTTETFTIETPGTVDLELHEPPRIIVQLQVG